MVALGLTLLLAATPKSVWILTLDNGDKLTVRTVMGDAGSGTGTGEWTRGGKPFDKAPFVVSGGPTSFELDRTSSQEELRVRLQGLQTALQSREWQALHDREIDANTKSQKCNAEKKAGCDEALQSELKTIKSQQQELTRAAVGALKSCEQLHLKLVDGKLVGQADSCADGKSHAVSGTMKAEP